MKALAFAVALLAASAAHAATLEAPNAVGGVIVLTDRQNTCPSGSQLAYATSAKGVLAPGCWFMADGRVFLSFDSGTTSVYEVDEFKVRNVQRAAPATNRNPM